MTSPIRKRTHQDIAAHRIPASQALSVERAPIYGLLDNIRSMYNVGSIFRTSDGALLKKLFLCGYTPSPPRKEIHKTSLGAAETVPWEYCKDPLDAIQQARSQGASICVLEQTDQSVPYHSIRPSAFPVCLVVGNELTGVSPAVIRAADSAIEIPMFGSKQSLNVAVAYGIALFELVRIWDQR
ncbi:MAG: RNA methyltransferase [Ignavibacteria bacterium]|nr:RNA methyltransferase [Ignavibacteria bacterium]